MEQTPHKIWFKRKRYGLGWYPVSWQGWLVILVYVLVLVRVAIEANRTTHSTSDTLIRLAIPYVLVTSVLIVVCYAKGENPRWHWGKDTLKNK